MKNQESETSEPSKNMEEKRYYFHEGGYMIKMPDGYYRAFFADGTLMTGVTLPINICLMALRGELPASVRICPSETDVAMEPSLKPLRDNYLAE
ncbi:MAG TPA: hypothetical protein PLV06_06130 [Bacteroidales bacterium]|nr:hypothetical protein [Bacteroidales bacterium]HPJ58796.1 hypothetical protein [Bacteroidales bacterium]HPR11946.1 hypothetical protein [Bacteroidales bacterium]HRW85762.1 hypothetical protein [Bacteroidales bacterium]